jgi:hypothetical protein
MKLLLTSLVATAGVFLVASPAEVSAQFLTEFTLPAGALFTCDAAASKCSFLADDFDSFTNMEGGRITSVVGGATVWTVFNETSNLLGVGVCTTTVDNCVAICDPGCICSQLDTTECPFITLSPAPTQAPTLAPTQVPTQIPTQAPSMVNGVKTLNPTSAPNSGAGSCQSSMGIALVMATMVSAFVAGL